jgi:hypothetical protein
MTFMMRPKVMLPTGTVIGPPVSVARIPRTTPSVGFIETVRTRLSPRWFSTSQTMSMGSGTSKPSLVTRTA